MIRERIMVLESLTNPIKAEMHPGILVVHGFLYSTIGIFVAKWIFEQYASLVMVFLTTMAAIPLIYNIIKVEEKKDLTDLAESNLLVEHSRALMVFLSYFLGTVLGFSFWYAVLPYSISSPLFSVQSETIRSIRSNVVTGNATLFHHFTGILANNLKVLIFCILFSFLYGLGAVFILTWNASVLGAAIGDTIKRGIYEIGKELHINTGINYANVIAYGLLKYSIHGIPEMASFFVAGLAGGIISTAAIRHDFGTKRYEKIILDASVLLLISLILVVIAAFLEVYVTPRVWGSEWGFLAMTMVVIAVFAFVAVATVLFQNFNSTR